MSTTTEGYQEMFPVAVPDVQDPSQFRISVVQVLNWGAYSDLQVMSVSRAGTVLLGPSGKGKSTLLDAMSSVIMPNPQEFNQAARDDARSKRERTVYTYARGYTDVRKDENQDTTTTHYLRPTGTRGFPSGVAITWENLDGDTVTCFRVAWVRSDATEMADINKNTMYGLVHDHFDLARLTEVTARTGASSPFTRTSLEPLIDRARGDVVDPSQTKMHARMRTSIGLGTSDESQELALLLLRRAQSSKGIGNINSLFKTLVLTEPLAPTRWQTVLESYQEASSLFAVFEDARRQAETLSTLPVYAEKYRAALQDAVDKQRLYTPSGDETSRIGVWHSGKVASWAHDRIEDVLLDKASLVEEISTARRESDAADARFNDALTAITAAGGDRSETLRARLEGAEKSLRDVVAHREVISGRLEPFGYVLPTSAGDVDLTRASIAEQAAAESKSSAGYIDAMRRTSGLVWNLRDRVEKQRTEIAGLKVRRSLIPPEAEQRRRQIAEALTIPVERLRYAGELLEIPDTHRRWEGALVKVLHRLASTLLVPAEHYQQVRRYVHKEDMRGVLHAEPVTPVHTGGEIMDGSVPALLDIVDHEFATWIRAQLTSRFNYLCVEGPDDLDQELPGWARGAMTSSGMVSGRRPGFTKDDARRTYPWIGRDPARLLRQMEDQLESLETEAALAETKADEASGAQLENRRRIEALTALATDLTWDGLDDTRAAGEVEQLRRDLERVNTPEIKQLMRDKEALKTEMIAKLATVTKLQEKQTNLDIEHGNLCTLEDEANDVLEDADPLSQAERQLLGQVPFAAPAALTQASVRASLADARDRLHHQVGQHEKDSDSAKGTVVAIIKAYRNLDERLARLYEPEIDALPAVEAAYHQLVEDDLPRARAAWLAKTTEDLNTALQRLLVQVKSDMREIRNGLNPINTVLSSVRFREVSTLSIDPQEHRTREQKDFTEAITRYTSNTVGIDVERDADEIEASFRRLRQHLRRLEDKTRTGESWQRKVFDAREQFDFRAIETRPDQTSSVYDGVSGMSGGEGQELIAFLMGAALRYRLGEGRDRPPRYGSLILDEGFVKSDSEYTGRALSVLKALGFQLIIGSPREKATAFEHYMDSVAYISRDVDSDEKARIYPMTMEQAMALDELTDPTEGETL